MASVKKAAYQGLSYNKTWGTWQAKVGRGGKKYSLGFNRNPKALSARVNRFIYLVDECAIHPEDARRVVFEVEKVD